MPGWWFLIVSPGAWLLETAPFMTRSQCGVGWTPGLKATYLVSQFAICVGHFLIAAALFWLYRVKRSESPRPEKFLVLMGFMVLGGMTHVADIAVFLWAPYRLYTSLLVINALATLGVAAYLPPTIRFVQSHPTHADIRRLNDELQIQVALRDLTIRERDQAYRQLHVEFEQARERSAILADTVTELERQLRTTAWVSQSNSAINRQLDRLRHLSVPPGQSGFFDPPAATNPGDPT
jgi:hypothetical protein